MPIDNPFGFSELLKLYDPKNLSKLFDPKQMQSWFSAQNIEGIDPAKIVSQHQERVEAMMQANKDAMASYQSQIARQMEIFDKMMAAARASLADMDLTPGAEATSKNMEVYSKALETSISLMQELSDETRKSAEEAYSRVSSQVEQAIKDITKT